ncbi:MAG: glutamate 5-kinase [Lachnospiraceae bacterium]|nr:glutamate 5-kinase [Lachnospiraceae bacterium]
MNTRDRLKDKRRIVIKIGSSSLTHSQTGKIDLAKLEKLVRILSDLRNQGKDVILVSSGAIAVGTALCRNQTHLTDYENTTLAEKQAFAAIGQAQLIMIYQKLFSEYGQTAAQVLMTKFTIANNLSRKNAENTFSELLKLGVIPVVNENDTVATFEIEFGDNDRLSAMVAAIVKADLLILLSDIDGLFTDDPNSNPNARFINIVPDISEEFMDMGKDSTGSSVGTGGMSAKLAAAKIATDSGTDMVISNGNDLLNIYRIINGEECGTLFLAHKNENFYLADYIEE